MENSVKKLTFLLVALIFSANSVFAQKIGYIFSEKVLIESQEAIDASKEFEKIVAEMQREYEQKQVDFRKLNEDIEKQSLLLSDEKKAQKQQQLELLYKEILEFEKVKFGPGGEAERKQNDLMKPIIEGINKIVKEVSENEGFDFVLDASVAGVIVYAKEDFDLTDQVVEALNKKTGE